MGSIGFARIRLTLRFELMCLEPDVVDNDKPDGGGVPSLSPPSVGLQRIEQLSKAGGAAHEDVAPHRSMSFARSVDLL